jgi:inner membrane protein
MPSPVGHSLVGCIIYQATEDAAVGRRRWLVPLLYVFAANAADLDLVPGFLMGNPNLYHRGISHSLGLAALFAVAFGPILACCAGERLRRATAIAFLLYLSHPVVDCFNVDIRPPFGVPLLWPLSSAYYIAPFPLLLDVQRQGTGGNFLTSLLSVHNLQTVTVELLVFLPCLGLVCAWKRLAELRRLKAVARQ